MAPEAGPRYTVEKLAPSSLVQAPELRSLLRQRHMPALSPRMPLLLLLSGETPATSSTMVPPLAEQVNAGMGAQIPRPW